MQWIYTPPLSRSASYILAPDTFFSAIPAPSKWASDLVSVFSTPCSVRKTTVNATVCNVFSAVWLGWQIYIGLRNFRQVITTSIDGLTSTLPHNGHQRKYNKKPFKTLRTKTLGNRMHPDIYFHIGIMHNLSVMPSGLWRLSRAAILHLSVWW